MLPQNHAFPRRLPTWARGVLVFAFLFSTPAASQAATAPQNLLAGKLPIHSAGVKNPTRLTDGLYSNEGDEWLTDVTSRFMSSRAFVDYDLGSSRELRCALTQADNNDVYILSGSQDGVNWQPLWRVGAENGAGMRLRNQKLDVTARYVRLSATGGDALYSVSEIALYSECPTIWPPELVRTRGITVADTVNTKVVIFGIFAFFFLLVHRRKAGRSNYVLILPVIAAGWMLAADLARLYPFFDQEPSLRALLAALAALVAIKETFFKQDAAPHRKVALATLAFCAVTSFATYIHFGAPQFFDDAKGRRTLVHTGDMRQTFPTAKYFRELRFDGLNLASLAAYADDHPNLPQRRLADVRLRDLLNNLIRTGGDLSDELAKVRARFSAERWEEFRRDMRYFADTMGESDYLASLQEHGGDATPAWILPAYLLFSHLPASEATLTATALIDPLLILLLFLVVARTFGLRVMLYLAVLWGTSDFYNFGTTFMGSTLRQDWLVALGLGICALKTRRLFLGGVLLAYAGLVRVFPSEAALFLVVPLLWFVFDFWREHRRLPRIADLRSTQRPALRALAGAAVCVLAALLLTTTVFGISNNWGQWQQKSATIADAPSANNVGLRTVIAFSAEASSGSLAQRQTSNLWSEWDRLQRANFSARLPLYYLVLLLATALGLLACRGRSLEQISLIGLLLVPFYSYAPNTCLHFVFLLPLVVATAGEQAERNRSFAWVVVVLAALAIGQAFSLAEMWTDLRYTDQSLLLLIGVSLILIGLARESWRLSPLWKKEAGETDAGRGARDA